MQTYWKCCPKTSVSAFRSATVNDDDDNVTMNMMTMNMMKMVNLSSVMRTVSLKTVLMPWLMVTAGLLFKLRDFED